MHQIQSTGSRKIVSLLHRIKVNAEVAMHSRLLLLLKAHTAFLAASYSNCLNSSLLTAKAKNSKATDAMVEVHFWPSIT